MSSVPFERRSFSGGATVAHLAADITSGSVTIPLDATTGWADGSNGPYYITIDRGQTTEERVRIVSLAGSNASCGGTDDRGVDGTTAQSHAAGATVEVTNSAIDDDEANQVAVATLGQIQAKGDTVVGTGPQTLTRELVGSDGLFLLADSTQTTGRHWGQIPAGAIASSPMFSSGVVDANALGSGAVTTSAIAGGAVTTTQIADGTIALADLGAGILNALAVFASPTLPVYISDTDLVTPAGGQLQWKPTLKRLQGWSAVASAWLVVGGTTPYIKFTSSSGASVNQFAGSWTDVASWTLDEKSGDTFAESGTTFTVPVAGEWSFTTFVAWTAPAALGKVATSIVQGSTRYQLPSGATSANETIQNGGTITRRCAVGDVMKVSLLQTAKSPSLALDGATIPLRWEARWVGA